MGNKLSIIFATLTGLCFISGLAVLTTSDEERSSNGQISRYANYN